MEQIDVITIFPEMLAPYLDASIIGKARERGLVSVNVHNPRDHTEDKHRTTDDTPYGGGAGMIMQVEPIDKALADVKKKQGKKAADIAKINQLVNQASDVRIDRVKEIKAQIADGTYSFDDQKILEMVADKIANALLR